MGAPKTRVKRMSPEDIAWVDGEFDSRAEAFDLLELGMDQGRFYAMLRGDLCTEAEFQTVKTAIWKYKTITVDEHLLKAAVDAAVNTVDEASEERIDRVLVLKNLARFLRKELG